jgi:hypothetical protein
MPSPSQEPYPRFVGARAHHSRFKGFADREISIVAMNEGRVWSALTGAEDP